MKKKFKNLQISEIFFASKSKNDFNENRMIYFNYN